jgi:benzoyl-CoA reductase/2-hydroxyglutaryl-CoA dehydratase subunit BcrC/BadD/HgdB
VEYYAQLIDATEGLIKQGVSPVGRERHRLLWDNLATWYNFRELQEYFAARGIAVVGSTYLDAWRKELTPQATTPSWTAWPEPIRRCTRI